MFVIAKANVRAACSNSPRKGLARLSRVCCSKLLDRFLVAATKLSPGSDIRGVQFCLGLNIPSGDHRPVRMHFSFQDTRSVVPQSL